MSYDAGTIRPFDSSRAKEFVEIRNVVVFTALTTIGAKVYIPHEPVPFTLQTLFVVLAGAFLGRKGGIASMLTYLLLGAAGIPVFAGQEAGFPVFAGATGGYLIGFVLSAAVVGSIIDLDESILWTALSMTAGFAIIFACGTAWLNAFFLHDWNASIAQGFLIFSFWDLVKLAAAVGVYRALKAGPVFHTNHKSEALSKRAKRVPWRYPLGRNWRNNG
jgi:biotin transport system substrate-specific component